MAIADQQTAPALKAAGPGPADWKRVLTDSICDLGELCRLLALPSDALAAGEQAARNFRLRVPRPFLARIGPGNLADPLLRQILPTAAENRADPRFSDDPLGEAACCLEPGMLRKYPGRTLIVTTSGCGVHCRYCFRRHMGAGKVAQSGRKDGAGMVSTSSDRADARLSEATPFDGVHVDNADRWARLARRLDREKTVGEVILSGGDPLVLDDEELAEAIGSLAAVGHLRRLRIHTRMPVVIPSRVTDALLTALRSSRLTCWAVLQINHPQEIDDDVARAVARLVDAGIPVLSQSVLLRGVNDRLGTLVELCERLVDLRVMPYYLHRLDRVAGAAHFDVPEHEGRRLIEKLRRRVPGYAVPRFVCEVPGESSKVPLD